MNIRFPIVLCLLLLSACSEPDSSSGRPERPAPRIVVETVEFANQRTRVEAVGTSRAIRSITIYPAVSDEVVAVHFKPGQYVNQGDLLLELDQRDERLAVELAEVRLKEAERLFQRYRDSVESGATLPTTLDAASAELDSARITLDRAQIDLADHNITAPFSGHVGITDIDPGDRVQVTTPVTTLDDRALLLVSFDVPELLIGSLRVGDEMTLTTWNANSTLAQGQIIDIDSRVDPQTRTFITRAKVSNGDDSMRPGMSFRVTLDLAGDSYPVLPEISLQWGAEGSYIWSVVDGRATRIGVDIVQRQKGRVLVNSSLQPGDLVVTEGVQRLREGVQVTTQVSVARATKGAAISSGPG